MKDALIEKIESLLFLAGEPVSVKRLQKVLRAERKEIEASLALLAERYRGRGLSLVHANETWQLGTAPEHAPAVESFIKQEYSEELSRAALETLAIIAYKGPLTRLAVDHVRGVNSSFSIRNLLMRGLIERMENPKNARSYLYRITLDFLRHLGLASPEELPQWSEFRASLEKSFGAEEGSLATEIDNSA